MADDFWRKFTDHIREIADKVNDKSWGAYKNLVIYTPDSIEQIHESFKKNHDSMKSQMKGHTKNLDRFKIVSAYTKAILTHPLFIPNDKAIEEFFLKSKVKVPKLPVRIKNPNAYLIFIMIRSVMHDFCSKVKQIMWSINPYHFYLPVCRYYLKPEKDGFKTEDSNFFYRFFKFLCSYDSKESIDKFPLFAFSNILLLLEMSNDCANFGLAKKYYHP
jgi:hypothetical protein